jgi:hypothetical protein
MQPVLGVLGVLGADSDAVTPVFGEGHALLRGWWPQAEPFNNPTRLKQNWPSDIPLPEVRLVYRWSPRFGRRPLTISFMRKRKLP